MWTLQLFVDMPELSYFETKTITQWFDAAGKNIATSTAYRTCFVTTGSLQQMVVEEE